ncbi:MAG: hypothetical protein PHR37_04945 [Eubacteriales bacterium]|nr:hypothetical protein [Eubacteriales bacterium]
MNVEQVSVYGFIGKLANGYLAVNKGFCDISHYIGDGKGSTGESLDIDFIMRTNGIKYLGAP